MRITTIINGKGGVGKTTTTSALATGLDKTKYKVLAIDYDPQGNLSQSYGLNVKKCPTIYHVFNEEIDINDPDFIQHTEQGDIVAGNVSLSKIESIEKGDSLQAVFKLKEQLESLKEPYTHIFIDNQPLIGGLLTRQTLVATNDVVIPVTADTFTVQGLNTLLEALQSVKKYANPNISIDGLLLTRYNPRTVLGSQIRDGLEGWSKELDTKVYQTYIRESITVREAQAKKKSLFDYAPSSNPAVDYMRFIREYLGE